MTDWMMLMLGAVLFVLSIGYVFACERL